ncbi:MAG: NAD-dependent epimerase/dehydratase family protein [Candidatus Bruticola sp.]
MVKVLVVGGGGFLGKALVRKLIERGDKVRSLSRGAYPDIEALGAEVVRGDIVSLDAALEAVAGCEAVFHTASKAGIWGNYAEYERVNVYGTRSLLEACRRQGVAKFIYTSTPSVIYHPKAKIENIQEDTPYPEHFECAYAQTKAQAEKEVLLANNQDMQTTALRPHLIYGPGDPHLIPRLVERAFAGQLFQVGDGTNKVDLTYIDNAAQSHIDAFEHMDSCAGKAYFISDGQPVVLWSWIKELLEKVGAPPITRSIPYGLTWGLGATLEFIYKVLHKQEEPKMTKFTAAQLATSHYFNIANARRDLQYKPEISGAEGMARLVDWIKEQGAGTLHHQ